MPGSTTPDEIIFPVAGDNLAPLESWFAQQAATTQTAISNLRTEVVKPDLPFPLSEQGASSQAVTATAWADLPNMPSITLTLANPCWVTIVLGARLNGASGQVIASARVTGATTLSETQLEVGGPATAFGQVMYTDSSTATRQASSIRTVRLNAGTNTITFRAYRTGSGTVKCDYATMQVSPIRWA